jgi:hypothetical protein
MFAEMDALTAQGLVPSQNIPMLFCPNQMVICTSGATPQAYVLRAWPLGTSSPSLECWGWGYDSHWLHRRGVRLTVNKPFGSVVKIAELGVFPARFASLEVVQQLKARGEKFWSLRYQSFVAYEGWDLKADQFYVSAPVGWL